MKVFLKLIALAFFLLISGKVFSAATMQCAVLYNQTCKLILQDGQQPLAFQFVTSAVSSDELVVKHITVTTHNGVNHRLTIPEMTPFYSDDKVSIYAQDINKNGARDIWFVTDRGAANAYAMYWLFLPDEQQFVSIGKYPWLTLDNKAGTAQAYERHGHGGRIYTKSLYRIEGRVLKLIEQEKQAWDSKKRAYIKTITKPATQ